MSTFVPEWKALFGPSAAERKELELMDEELVVEGELSPADQVLRIIAQHRAGAGWACPDIPVEL